MTTDGPASPQGSGLVRLRLDLGYDGAGFSGWATQPGLRTVQGTLEQALQVLLRSGPVALTVAGRTDAGVHATGQVAHCDVDEAVWTGQAPRALRRVNGLLPPDVRVYAMTVVSGDFDARFSAVWRRYRYRIADAAFGVDPLLRHDTVGWKRSLDADVMHEAAQGLLGLHDYAAFCKRRDGATTVRTLQGLDVVRTGDLIEIEVQADAFCHSMVRSLVGALAAVGEGRRPVEWPATLLTLAARADAVAVAPAHGLTLVEVGYPHADQLAARAVETRAVRTSDAK